MVRFANRLFCGLFFSVLVSLGDASSNNFEISIDSSLAEQVFEAVCSERNEYAPDLLKSELLHRQIEHHSNLNEQRNLDIFKTELEAAINCNVTNDDDFHFQNIVRQKADFQKTTDYIISRSDEIIDFVISRSKPYMPEELDFTGSIVLTPVGQNCGGFSSREVFFVSIACLVGSVEQELTALKMLALHETYHAIQSNFMASSAANFAQITNSNEAQFEFFLNLILEGTAAYIADGREVKGSGVLTNNFSSSANKGYNDIEFNFRLLNYAVEIIATDDNSNQRFRDAYALGFTGKFDERFYYVGATIAQEIETVFGVEVLLCVMQLTPEQFLLIYDETTRRDGNAHTLNLGEATIIAAHQIGRNKESYRTCLQ